MIEEAQKVQKNIENIQKKLETEEISVISDDRNVTVKITGNNKFTGLTIAENLKNVPIDELQKTVLTTFQKAIDAAHKKNEEAIKEITASLKLPTLEEIKTTAQKAPKK